MNFIAWHFSSGIEYYTKKYILTLEKINHFFSLGLLVKTLFSPYKRLIVIKEKPGFDLAEYFERLSFNLVSRFIGFWVRLFLIIIGFSAYLFVFIFGAIGLVVWIFLPPLSYRIYNVETLNPKIFAQNLVSVLRKTRDHFALDLFDNKAGNFFLKHLNLSLNEIAAGATKQGFDINKFEAENYSDLIKKFLEENFWTEEFLRSKNLEKIDLLWGAYWWDYKLYNYVNSELNSGLGKAGIGLELVYGYTPTLNKYSEDMADAASQFSHHLIGRQKTVSKIERVLSSGNNVLLIGEAGVGKKTVVYEFAKKAANGALGKKLSYFRVLEFSYNDVLSQTTDSNQKKNLIAKALLEAEAAGNVILVLRDLERLTRFDLEGIDMTDVLEKILEKRNLKTIVISDPKTYEKFLSNNSRLMKYFERVDVNEPSESDAMQIIIEASDNWEQKKDITVLVNSLRTVISSSEKYISNTPFPEKALEILDAAIFEDEQNGDGVISIEDINNIISEKARIPIKTLNNEEKKDLANIEDIIHKSLINQSAAVAQIGQILRSKITGVVSTNRPIGSFLFLGPSGVGKTETAKVLSQVYFGSQEKIIKFNMADYSSLEGVERLLGSASKNSLGLLTSQIKNNPASLLLLDEIEKAPSEVFNIFLSLLDEGEIYDSNGDKVSCSNLFVIATSNAGAEFIRQEVNNGTKGIDLQKKVLENILQNGYFSPEFVNRFDGVVVYEPLSFDHLRDIAKLQLNNVSKNLYAKNMYIDFDESVYDEVLKNGYQPEFGARPMRRYIELSIGDFLAKAILNNELVNGSHAILKYNSLSGFNLVKLTEKK